MSLNRLRLYQPSNVCRTTRNEWLTSFKLPKSTHLHLPNYPWLPNSIQPELIHCVIMSGGPMVWRQRLHDIIWTFWTSLTRTKTLDVKRLQDTELRRCLNVVDLTALGVGSTLGAGIYVITGQVAKFQAGPAVVLSFLIAAVASLLAGVCYAEFAARVPRAGSAYTYSYVSVGEFWAFVIGWNMILENVIGAASVGKAWSEYFDAMINDTIKRSIIENVGPFHSPGLGGYPDFLAMVLLLLVTLLVSMGVKMSSVLSFFFTLLNVLIIMVIIGIGVFNADGRNWTDPPGFFPKGFRGVISGAATCFYAFVGFDTIATSGEEAKRPTKTIPSAILATLVICFLAYFGVSTVLTLLVPWYKLADTAALPKAFAMRGIIPAEYLIAVGGMCGLAASMMGSIFPLPRTVYAMAQDGLVFRWMGWVSMKTETPVLATWICGGLAALMALLLDLDSLVQMMSIGTLMAYTMVSLSVLVLHYQRENVGYCAADIHDEISMVRDSSELSEGTIQRLEAEYSTASEGTGLLRIGDGVKKVQYVPSKQTTVFKRISSTAEDSDEEEGETKEKTPELEKEKSFSRHSSMESGAGSRRSTKEVIEEVRTKREQKILRRMANYMSTDAPEGSTYQRMDSNYSLNSLGALFNFGEVNSTEPTEMTRRIAIICIVIMIMFWAALCSLIVYGEQHIAQVAWWAIALLVLFGIVVLCCLIVLLRQPKNSTKLGFSTPFVPIVPLASALINIFLMLTLSPHTWLRFLVWMALGFLMYFGYGIRHSSEKRAEDQEVILYDVADQEGVVAGVYTN